MTDTDRWTALFARNDALASWERHVRRTDEKLRSFLEFEPAKTLGISNFHPAELLAPSVERVGVDPMLAAQVPGRGSGL